MQWGWALAYGALAVLAARAAWRTPEWLVGIALVVNVVAYNVVCAVVPVAYGPGVAMLTEVVSFEAAIICLILTGRAAPLALAFLSIESISVSAMKSLDILPLFGYEELINVILVAQCAILSRRGLMNVVLRVGSSWRNLYRRRNVGRLPSNGMAAVPGRTTPVTNSD